MEVAQVLGSWEPWCTKCAGTPTALATGAMDRFLAFLASGSWQSEGFFGWSFSVAWPVQALTGPLSWGPSLLFGASGT